jgi:hypothetical protein
MFERQPDVMVQLAVQRPTQQVAVADNSLASVARLLEDDMSRQVMAAYWRK